MNSEYMSRFVTAETAAKAVKSGDWVDFGFGTGFPELMDKALAARAGELTDVKIRGGLVYAPKIELLEADPEHKAFTWYSWHIGAYERKKQAEGQIRFVPMLLRQVPFLYRQHYRVDVAVVPVSKPDADGYCTFGAANYCFRTIMEGPEHLNMDEEEFKDDRYGRKVMREMGDMLRSIEDEWGRWRVCKFSCATDVPGREECFEKLLPVKSPGSAQTMYIAGI